MTPDEIERAIDGRWRDELTGSLRVQAKSYLANRGGPTGQLIDGFVASMGAQLAPPVAVHASVHPEVVVSQVSKWIACRAAAAEAVWALIGTGALVPTSDRSTALDLRVEWTTVIPGSGGSTSSWRFGDPQLVMPESVRPVPVAHWHLTDGDIYLANLGLANLDAEIVESLRLAVECIRHDLFLPAQVMLARAIEGVWRLLAEAMIGMAPTAGAKLAQDLDGLRFARLPGRVVDLYEDTAYADVVAETGVKPGPLADAAEWTHTLRRARNAVHAGTDAPMPATWDNTAALLMGSVPNLRQLWAIVEAARGRPK